MTGGLSNEGSAVQTHTGYFWTREYMLVDADHQRHRLQHSPLGLNVSGMMFIPVSRMTQDEESRSWRQESGVRGRVSCSKPQGEMRSRPECSSEQLLLLDQREERGTHKQHGIDIGKNILKNSFDPFHGSSFLF